MEKENKKEEIQSRREFFKNAAKSVLPILGAVALLGNPIVAKAVEKEEMGCDYGCYQSCYYACSGSCKTACSGCKGSCQGACQNGCLQSCYGTCSGGCARSAYA